MKKTLVVSVFFVLLCSLKALPQQKAVNFDVTREYPVSSQTTQVSTVPPAADAPVTLTAFLTLDHEKIGEGADREISIAAISSDGYIQGKDGEEINRILFSDIEEIVWNPNTRTHVVKTWDQKTHVIKWGYINSNTTATEFIFEVKDEKSGELRTEYTNQSYIKRLAFPRPQK